MKLISYKYCGESNVGVLSFNETSVISLQSLGIRYAEMNQLISDITSQEFNVIKQAALDDKHNGISYKEIELLAPIPRPTHDIICLGKNYLDHAKEFSAFEKKEYHKNEYPIYFSKRVNHAVPSGGKIMTHEDYVNDLDYEVELAVIISKDAYKVNKENAFDYVFGYTIINDISARDIQSRHGQWYLGKSLDSFTPMGPCIVTKDEFNIPPDLNIKSKVNGIVRQNANTKNMIFSIAHVIEELSRCMTLEAATIISMGTPAGVGIGYNPARLLKAGDIVQCEIEGIGILMNSVV